MKFLAACTVLSIACVIAMTITIELGMSPLYTTLTAVGAAVFEIPVAGPILLAWAKR